MDKINEALENLGFEEREIKIYLALISEQDLAVLQISKKTGIDRSTTYDILEKMLNKGIVTFYLKNKVKHFKALSPEKLLTHFKDKYASLKSVLPSLKQIENKFKEIVGCELFQGVAGFKTVLENFVEEGVDYMVIGVREEYENVLGYWADHGILLLNELKMKGKAIVERDLNFTKLKNESYRSLDKKLLSNTSTLIYGDNIVFFIWKDPYFAIRIKSKELAIMQEEYFDLLWKIAKP